MIELSTNKSIKTVLFFLLVRSIVGELTTNSPVVLAMTAPVASAVPVEVLVAFASSWPAGTASFRG